MLQKYLYIYIKPSFEDKLRLAAIYISDPKTPMGDIQEVIDCVKELYDSLTPEQREGLSVDALLFLKDLKSLSLPNTMDDPSQKGVSSFLSQATGLFGLATAVKHFIPSSKNYTTTQLVDELANRKNGSAEGYLFYDPKVPNIRGVPDYLKGTTFDEIIVFVVGGGAYCEYHNLKLYAQNPRSKKNIIYGCTELLSSKEFLEELTKIVTDSK